MRTFPLIKRKKRSQTSVLDYLHFIWENGTFRFTVAAAGEGKFLLKERKKNHIQTFPRRKVMVLFCGEDYRTQRCCLSRTPSVTERKKNKARMLKRRSFIPQTHLPRCAFPHSVLLLHSLSHFKIGPWKWVLTCTHVRARIASNTSRKIFLSGTWIGDDPVRISASTAVFTVSLIIGCRGATCCLLGLRVCMQLSL